MFDPKNIPGLTNWNRKSVNKKSNEFRIPSSERSHAQLLAMWSTRANRLSIFSLRYGIALAKLIPHSCSSARHGAI